MSEDWTPVRIEQAIHDAAQRISKGVLVCDRAYKAFLKADHEYDIAFAECYLGHEHSPAHQRKYEAELGTTKEREARDLADAAYKVTDRQMKALMTELDALRSIGTSVRQAYAVAGRGE